MTCIHYQLQFLLNMLVYAGSVYICEIIFLSIYVSLQNFAITPSLKCNIPISVGLFLYCLPRQHLLLFDVKGLCSQRFVFAVTRLSRLCVLRINKTYFETYLARRFFFMKTTSCMQSLHLDLTIFHFTMFSKSCSR